MAEEAGGPPGRVKLHGLPTLRPGLICQHCQEPVDGLGVVQVAQQLAAVGAVSASSPSPSRPTTPPPASSLRPSSRAWTSSTVRIWTLISK